MLYKRTLYCLLIIFLGIISFFSTATVSKAASGTIDLSTKSENVKKGNKFYVICRVSSETAFLDAKFQIGYDDEKMEFLGGGSKVTGGGGDIIIDSTGNTSEVNKKTFSLEFKAKKKGYSILSLESSPSITNSDGEEFSVSSNQLTIEISKTGTSTIETGKTGTGTIETGKTEENKTNTNKAPVDKPKTSKSGISNKSKSNSEQKIANTCRLKSMKTSALSMKPDFSPDTTEYTAKIDKYSDILYFSLQAENENDKIQIIGNENLKKRINNVKVVVTSESGQKRIYKIKVSRDDSEEKNENQADDESDENQIDKLSNINSISEARNNYNTIKDFILYGIILGLALFLLVMIIYVIRLKIKIKRNG